MALKSSIKITSFIAPADAIAISDGSDDLRNAIVKLAENDIRVREYLYDLSTSGIYLDVVSASLAIILPIIVNHIPLTPQNSILHMLVGTRHRVDEHINNGAEKDTLENPFTSP